MHKKAITFALAAALLAALAPGASQANHCGDNRIFIFSGQNDSTGIPQLNGGVGPCALPSAAHAVNLSYTVPGATHLRVGAIHQCADGTRSSSCQPASGTLEFTLSGGGTTTRTLNWTWQATNSTGQTVDRWISQQIAIPATATQVKATANLRDPNEATVRPHTVTQNRLV